VQGELADAIVIDIDDLPRAVDFPHPVEKARGRPAGRGEARLDDLVLAAADHVPIDFEALATELTEVVGVIRDGIAAECRNQRGLLLRGETGPGRTHGEAGHERQREDPLDHRLELSESWLAASGGAMDDREAWCSALIERTGPTDAFAGHRVLQAARSKRRERPG